MNETGQQIKSTALSGLPRKFDLKAMDFDTSMSPQRIVQLALVKSANPIISTNFRPGAVALLHMVVREHPDIPVLWVDTGFNTAATYRYVEQLRNDWALNLKVYAPLTGRNSSRVFNQPIPLSDEPKFDEFVEVVKLEPFRRAFDELAPDAWFTGVRREQTAFRSTLDIVSAGPNGSNRVAPLLNWTGQDVQSYIAHNQLPEEHDYFDPTKPKAHLECGLQLVN
ncbi:MAG: phosphoadenosine phosphosulfate reductase domain-containing protein [Gammaproteobacteria bacterium]